MVKGSFSYLCIVGAAGAVICAALVSADPKGPRRPGAGGNTDVPSSFVNWETGHVHPVDLTPDASKLLVCNTADNRLEVFDLSGGLPVLSAEIPVGLDPIAVRARTNDEAWVVNNISDSVSIVKLSTRNVIATLTTKDEPSDVAFAGTPQRAFVSCSQANTVQVFDPANLATAPTNVAINGEDPRALAVSPNGQTVYAAVFNSGNASTILGGGATGTIGFPPNVVNDNPGPYNGVNPPPNSGAGFDPPLNAAAGTPPRVGMIVKKNAAGQWMDDNNHDWSIKVSGAQAANSGRPVGWNLPDRDLARIDASSLSVTYATGIMNILMASGVNPATGEVTIVGTDATNERRFEPNVRGRFVHVNIGLVNPSTLASTVKDLNPHLLPYTNQQVTQSERNKSIGDPRGVAWNPTGTRAFIAGMGSDNVVVVNTAGDRAGLADTIPVGRGPTGVAFDAQRSRVYVLNRFDASVSVIDSVTQTVVSTVPFFDPTPTAIKVGRKHLYDTHKTSGLGQASCASCHIDGRIDRLAWDLGDPSGTVKQLTGQNLGAGIPGLSPGSANPAFQPWHPMKGPMTTQTLQDIIGKEPHHWRGDRAGLEEFNPAFVGLLGDDVQLTNTEMQEFEDFLASIFYPPNPFRNFDNTLPATLTLTGHFTSGRFGPAGQPLPLGHPNTGLALYTDSTRRLDNNAFACVTCHTLPTGAGTDSTLNIATQQYTPLAVGPQGQHHLQLVSTDGSTNLAIKTPQLRNAYLKVGFDTTQVENNAGFGFLHDGSVDSIARFVTEPIFTLQNDQEVADIVSFILCFSGSDLPAGGTNVFTPPGVLSNDTHAGVGVQTTLVSQATAPATQLSLISSMIAQAQSGKVGLVVKGIIANQQRGFTYLPGGTPVFQSDRAGQSFTPAALLALASVGQELTYTVVPKGSETRIGIDRDLNGILDRDQADTACYANCDGSHTPPILTANDFQCFLNLFASGSAQANCDGSSGSPLLTANDFQCFINRYAGGCP